MALITCPDCGGKVSDKANACIHCGRPMQNDCVNTINTSTSFLDIDDIIKEIMELGNPPKTQFQNMRLPCDYTLF